MDQDTSFPVGFQGAVSEALLFVCKDRLTFESLILTGNLFVSLDHGKTSCLQITESITNDATCSAVTNNYTGPIVKQEADLQTFESYENHTHVNDESLNQVEGLNNVEDTNAFKESSSDMCDGEITEKDIITAHDSQYLALKIENSLDITFEQNDPPCIDVSSKHPVLSSQLLASSMAVPTPTDVITQGKSITYVFVVVIHATYDSHK